jgi:hypothetical protein
VDGRPSLREVEGDQGSMLEQLKSLGHESVGDVRLIALPALALEELLPGR